MKLFNKLSPLLAIIFMVTGCSKSEDAISCEESETTKVTFTNNGAASLRVEMASQFDAQFNPVNPVFVIDLAPGASSVKEFRYGNYFIQWKANCSTTCTQQAFYARNFDVCGEYQESQ